MRRYSPGCAGFVVEVTTEVGRAGRPLRSYWLGPRSHGFIGWGALDDGAAVYASRPAAKRAFEAEAGAGRAGIRFRRVADVEEERSAMHRP